VPGIASIATGWRRFTYFPAVCLLLISGCGGGGSSTTVTIGGTVTGLLGKLVLQNTGGDNLTVTADGTFTFATPVSKGASYAVTILTQPAGPACAVANGSGTSTVNVTNVSVTCTVDPATVFVPVSATSDHTTTPGPTGLFVVSTKSPGDPPIQITTQAIQSFGLLSRYTPGPQGTASVASPYAIMYTTLNSSSGDHVWSVRLSGTSTLTPTQLSNLTIPYYSYSSNAIDHVTHVCSSWLIAKNLADPSSVFLILSLPTDVMKGCQYGTADRKVLIHSSDGPATDPVTLPALSDGIQPLYRPDGTLAGLLATDTANNLNLYPDETFTNPKLLLTNAPSFSLVQEPQPVGSYAASADPTYGFLLVTPSVGAPYDVYHVDYSGAISAKLYSLQNTFGGVLVDSHTLYYVESTEQAINTYLLTVGRILAGGGPVLTLASTIETAGIYIPSLVGLTGSHLVFESSATSTESWSVQTVPTDTTGSFTTIASGSSGSEYASVADGDVFVTQTTYSSTSSGPRMGFSSEIVDVAGNVLQPLTPFSAFMSSGAPVIQVKNIPTYYDMRGGQLYALDLSTPATPNPVPLTTSTGTPYTLPIGTTHALFKPLTPTISIAQDTEGLPDGTMLIYDQSTGVVAPVSIPNSTLSFLTQPD
jgi:hypothetical protein